MAKLANALASVASGRKTLGVQISLWALTPKWFLRELKEQPEEEF